MRVECKRASLSASSTQMGGPSQGIHGGAVSAALFYPAMEILKTTKSNVSNVRGNRVMEETVKHPPGRVGPISLARCCHCGLFFFPVGVATRIVWPQSRLSMPLPKAVHARRTWSQRLIVRVSYVFYLPEHTFGGILGGKVLMSPAFRFWGFLCSSVAPYDPTSLFDSSPLTLLSYAVATHTCLALVPAMAYAKHHEESGTYLEVGAGHVWEREMEGGRMVVGKVIFLISAGEDRTYA